MGKFGINSKAVEGRERKKEAADAKDRQKQVEKEAKEAESWKDGAKTNSKKESEEAKRLEKLAKKKEREELEAAEVASIKSVVSVKGPAGPNKKTQYELLMRPSPLSTANRSSSNVSQNSLNEFPMEPLNRPGSTVHSNDHDESGTQYSASNLDDAISLLEATALDTDRMALERHPERRVKAAYALFIQLEMPILKLENPGLRLSQLRQLLKRKWEKAPSNPYNQASISYRASREEEQEAARSVKEKQLDRFKS